MSLVRTGLLAASQSVWLREHAMRWPFVRRATRRFLPGETLEDALAATRTLEASGLPTLLTRLGENLDSVNDAREVMDHYLHAQDRLRQTGLRSEMSVKLTQLGLDQDEGLAAEQLGRIAADASTLGRNVWVDMEGSAYTQRTMEVFTRVRASHRNLGIAIQAYLRRTEADLEALLAAGTPIRLVKGAYDEPASVALRTRDEVDAAYLRFGRLMLARESRAAGAFPAFGTHDDALIGKLSAHADAQGWPRDAYEFEMLYGIRPALQARLVAAGRRVRVLISYGEAWFPWYMRRLAERPANVWFVVRNALARG